MNAARQEAGAVAFEAYLKSVGGVTYDGKPIHPSVLPGQKCEGLTPAIREAWRDAGGAVLAAGERSGR